MKMSSAGLDITLTSKISKKTLLRQQRLFRFFNLYYNKDEVNFLTQKNGNNFTHNSGPFDSMGYRRL